MKRIDFIPDLIMEELIFHDYLNWIKKNVNDVI